MKKTLYLSSFCLLFLGAGCNKTDDSKLQVSNELSYNDERNIGYYLDEYFTQAEAVALDGIAFLSETVHQEVYDYLSQIKNKILATELLVAPAEWDWTIRLYEQKNNENAFVFPGGYIYLSVGLMQQLDNEAQLMGLLSDMMVNIDDKHCTQKLEQQFGRNFLVDVSLGGNEDSMPEMILELSKTPYSAAVLQQIEAKTQNILCQADYNIQYFSTFLLNTKEDNEWAQLFPSYENREAILHYAENADGCIGQQIKDTEYAQWLALLP